MTQINECPNRGLESAPKVEKQGVGLLIEAAAFYGPRAVVLTAMYQLGTLPYNKPEQLHKVESELELAFRDYWFKFVLQDLHKPPPHIRERALRDEIGIVADDLVLGSIKALRSKLREGDAADKLLLQARHAENLAQLMLREKAKQVRMAQIVREVVD